MIELEAPPAGSDVLLVEGGGDVLLENSEEAEGVGK